MQINDSYDGSNSRPSAIRRTATMAAMPMLFMLPPSARVRRTQLLPVEVAPARDIGAPPALLVVIFQARIRPLTPLLGRGGGRKSSMPGETTAREHRPQIEVLSRGDV
ncbi:MAG: hypothetical protein OXN89_08475 [Bryobacterales bacterium]|nr:hypothetical protein [Bryobacterales bacterium]